eukprot:CAMPEP_0181537206 /NCGR_PEP_ID=MMETSP1110-20121109/75227_1 /TAXON_ID=174948 /ORGANISM="Symbiodinium sp., Strain CCMP421" /LENGTH=91 /DNA_ID=CAMNT_0023668761 /DNA_START=257 /DNA_END=533 /DNA_ORIENTATION=-
MGAELITADQQVVMKSGGAHGEQKQYLEMAATGLAGTSSGKQILASYSGQEVFLSSLAAPLDLRGPPWHLVPGRVPDLDPFGPWLHLARPA